MRKLLLFFLFIAFLNKTSVAQDVQFSQFYAAPTYQNPAFAGSAHATRAIFQNRLQWPGIGGANSFGGLSTYSTSLFTADTYFDKYRSGVGIVAMRDWQGGSTLASTQIGLQYAYELPISNTFSFRPGLQLDYVNRSVDYSKLRFPQDFNDQTGYTGNTVPAGVPNKQYADISSGMMFYSEQLWVGLSAHHMNRPNQSFQGNTSLVPIEWGLTAGYKIHLGKRNYLAYLERAKEISITPTIYYKKQGQSDQVDAGIYLIYDQLMAGLWYRGLPLKKYDDIQNNESLIILLGWKFNAFSIGYSYDFTVSRLQTVRTGGSHELNITYVHQKSHKYKPMKRLPCPSFYKN